jgi:hypothetical protein
MLHTNTAVAFETTVIAEGVHVMPKAKPAAKKSTVKKTVKTAAKKVAVKKPAAKKAAPKKAPAKKVAAKKTAAKKTAAKKVDVAKEAKPKAVRKTAAKKAPAKGRLYFTKDAYKEMVAGLMDQDIDHADAVETLKVGLRQANGIPVSAHLLMPAGALVMMPMQAAA